MDHRHGLDVDTLYRPLWLTYGLVPLLAGLDKFFNILADWPGYLSPVFSDFLPMSPQAFMYAVGVIEVIVGLMVLSKWTRIGAWVAAAWLVAIAINLVTLGLYDIAVRDIAMAIGAYTLAQLAAARAGASTRGPAQAELRG